jgi:hypothetical protein
LKQEKGEPVDSFIKKVRVLAKECKYSNVDEHIIDALIFGSVDPRVQSKLLEHDASFTLNKAIDIARTAEATTSQLADMRSIDVPTKSINSLKQSKPEYQQQPSEANSKLCRNCGTKHELTKRSVCPDYNTECRKCHKLHHWERVCRSKKPNTSKEQSKGQGKGQSKKPYRKIHSISEETTSVSDEVPQLYFHTITASNSTTNSTQAFVNLKIDSGQTTKNIECKIDTGAEGNVIPLNIYAQLFPNASYNSSGQPKDLTPSNTNITAFGGHAIKHYGICSLTLSYSGSSNQFPFHVVNTTGPVILGLPTCTDMNLVTLNYTITTQSPNEQVNLQTTQAASTSKKPPDTEEDPKASLLNEYPDCFNGIGCFDGEFHITLDPDVPPVVHPPRRVPEALQD